MNTILLTQIQEEAIDCVLPYIAGRWAVDGIGIKEMIEYHDEDTDKPLPTSWTLPKIEHGELILSDFYVVNDSLREYIFGYGKMKSSDSDLTDYRKRKIKKECKALVYKIDSETMFKSSYN